MTDFLSNYKGSRPNKLKPNPETYNGKDKLYHVDFAKHCYAKSHTAKHADFLVRTKLNKEFYANRQWGDEEDTEAFLKDETGNLRNRIKVTHNIIRPMVEQYRGNAIRMAMNATAQAISKKSIDRKDKKLKEKLLKSDLAESFPGLSTMIRESSGVGRNQQETTEIFENYYVDEYEENITKLVKYSSWLNELEEKQAPAALNLALSGIIVMNAFEHGGHLRYELTESEDYFFDPSAKKIDHTDAEFKGIKKRMISSEIFETYQNISHPDREAIERYVSNQNGMDTYDDNSNQEQSGKIHVIRTYWKDIAKYEYGYVKDEYGYAYLTKINFKNEGEEEPKYTDEDLIDPPVSKKNTRLFKGRKKRFMFVDELRYCDFIPGEYIGYTDNDDERKTIDVVLDYGIYDFQETQMLDVANVNFPIKTYCWSYLDGEILSPVDDAINPQRFINRILSVGEAQINSSGGTNIIYDETAIDDQGGEGELIRNINQGNPVKVSSRGKGITNTVGTYDATPKKGTYDLFNTVSIIKQLAQDTSGINEGLKGESTGQDQLVGVTQLLIQRGSLMQEPFYLAIQNTFKQLHNFCATVGKRMYLDNERELSFSIGDNGLEVVKLSKEMRNEDFRVFVKRDNTDEMMQQQANQMLTMFLEFQLIDNVVFADNYNRSTPTEVSRALRRYTSQKIEAQKEMSEQQAVEGAQMEKAQGEAYNIQQAQALSDRAQDQQHEINKIAATGQAQAMANRQNANN